MRQMIVLLAMLLFMFVASCQPSPTENNESRRYYPVGVSDADPVETPKGYGNKAILEGESRAQTGRATMKYDKEKAALLWHCMVSLEGNMPQKVVLIVNFYDKNGNVVVEDTADAVILAPGEKKDVKHDAKITMDDAARIIKWDARIRFVKD